MKGFITTLEVRKTTKHRLHELGKPIQLATEPSNVLGRPTIVLTSVLHLVQYLSSSLAVSASLSCFKHL